MKRMLSWIVALIFTLAASTGSLCAQDKDLTGNWQGTLQAGRGLRIVMKITKDDGKLKGISYSIDQGGQPIPITSITVNGTSFNFTISALDVTYTGTLSPDGNTITGNQTQGGQTNVMNFQRATADTAWAIPEPPKSMAADAIPKFDVITIKPSDPSRQGKGFTVRGRHVMTFNTTLSDLVTFAYGLHSKQVLSAPTWFATDKFDLDGVPDIEGRPSAKQMRLLIQSALTDRFKLTFHHDKKELAVYALEIGKGGPKMTETIHQPADPRNFLFRRAGDLMVTNSTMQDFSNGMQEAVMDKPVVDHTGLTARYDFTLKWTPDESQFEAMGGYRAPATEDPNAPPSLSTAMQEQLGLKFDATKAQADVFVIDHVEKPSEN
jgi:uncharacterized protein (TIGR03435 family)